MCPQEELVRHIFRFASERIRSIQPNIYPIEGRCRAPKIQFILFEANETCFTSMPIMSSLIGQRQWSYKEKHFSYYVYSIERSSNSTPSIMNTHRVQRSLFWFSFYSVRSVAHLIVCLFLLFCEPFSWLRTMSK